MGQGKVMPNDGMIRIPKLVHYCWFGGHPLGSRELECIESWRKFLPGYQIIRWDESNWDVRCCDYVSEAYDAKKWAFVSDYARIDILYRKGGLYFDTDVELIRPIDDILARGPFMGYETDFSDGVNGSIAPGLGLATYPGLEIYREILDSYESDHFVEPDGSLDETTIVTRVTKILLEHGLEKRPGIQQIDGLWLYPSEFFNPKSYLTNEITMTNNTRSIHHFSMSWYTPLMRERHDIMSKLLAAGVGKRRAEIVSKLLASIKTHDLSYVKIKLAKVARSHNRPRHN